MALLSDYAWPGNIRELRNVLERVYVETVVRSLDARRSTNGSKSASSSRRAPGMWRLGRRLWPSARC